MDTACHFESSIRLLGSGADTCADAFSESDPHGCAHGIADFRSDLEPDRATHAVANHAIPDYPTTNHPITHHPITQHPITDS